jgi:uncharacterized membrane protein YfcA
MSPEKRELALSGVLGLLAGPCYLVAGPANFLTWYSVIIGGGLFSTAFWLREVRATWKLWLAWPVVMAAGAALSMLVCVLIQNLAKGGL